MIPVANLDLKHSLLNGLAVMLLSSGQIDEAKATIDADMNVAKLSGKTDHLIDLLTSSSILERYLGFHESALAKLDEAVGLLHRQALFLADDQKKSQASGLAICYTNKAQIYQEDGNLDEALAWLEKADEQYKVSGDKLNAGKALFIRGDVHCANADLDKGFDCYKQAVQLFLEISNALWIARAAERISRLYATYENWEEATKAILAAVDGAEKAGHPGEQVHFLCEACEIVGEWMRHTITQDVNRQIHGIINDTPDEKKEAVIADLVPEKHEALSGINKRVREDNAINDLLNQAKEIAQREHLHQHLANCLLDEAHGMTPPDDTETRHKLICEAIELLKEELREAQAPKHRGRLMARISGLYEGTW